MNLQWLGHGNCARTGMRGAGLALAALMISTWTGTGASAWAQVATRTQLTATRTSSGSATGRSFIAEVKDVAGNPVSSGTVSFESGKGSIGSAVVKSGTANLDADTLPPGTTSVTAVYHGDSAFAASSSALDAHADASALPDFSVTGSPTSVTLNPGDYGSVVLSITPLNGFTDMVTLSCSGVPSAAACLFSPTNVTPLKGAVATSTLQIQTEAASGTTTSLRPGPLSHSEHLTYAILPGVLALAGLGALRRRSGLASLRILGVVALMAAGSMGLSSCAARYGYLHKPPAANPGILAGTYTITVAAYSNNGTSVTSHLLPVTLTVK
jgi:Bacterial Ig-like domain (group 3)